MPQTILLVHTEAAKAELVKCALFNATDNGFLVEWVELCSDAIRRLRAGELDRVAVILLGLDLPDRQGVDAFDALFRVAPNVPIAILCSAADESSAKLAVLRGAQNYLCDADLGDDSLLRSVRSMIDRASNAEALFSATERAEVTLNCIGDAVISTDLSGSVTFLNPVAESLTGWSSAEALGRPIDEVLRIVDGSHERRTLSPLNSVAKTNLAAKLPFGCKLIRRDSIELAIEDSAAPIHDRTGRVTGAVMVFHDVTQAQATSKKMSYLAQHDYLTDLPNRLLLNDRLSQAIEFARRHKLKLAVLYADLDRFKHVNDSLGHAIGDELLRSITARLVSSVRSSHTVSRQGGDEFVILLSSIQHADDAMLCAQKLISAAGMSHQIEKHNLQITLSVGISIYPEDGVDAETLVKNADIAMLHAKENGRNSYQFFKPSMNERAVERQSIESGLRYALEKREFLLLYQPKVDLVTETFTSVEALIRWQPRHQELVSPREFIPIAEQCGYIVPIGRWVLRQVCAQNRAWLDAKMPPIPIAVNISAVELRSNHFVEHVRAILQETGTDPSSLEFELTETSLMQDPKTTVAVLKKLKDMGIQITLDDFGTGYSSLSHLRKFPIDALKIDRSFVRGLCTNADDAKIVNAVINLGRSFHLNVIAEGVETRAQFLALQGQNCGQGQGYYFRKPMVANEFIRLMVSDPSTTDVA